MGILIRQIIYKYAVNATGVVNVSHQTPPTYRSAIVVSTYSQYPAIMRKSPDAYPAVSATMV